jgi:hypothetical protein
MFQDSGITSSHFDYYVLNSSSRTGNGNDTLGVHRFQLTISTSDPG